MPNLLVSATLTKAGHMAKHRSKDWIFKNRLNLSGICKAVFTQHGWEENWSLPSGPHFNFSSFFFFCMYKNVLLACMQVHHVPAMLVVTKRVYWGLLELSLGVLVLWKLLLTKAFKTQDHFGHGLKYCKCRWIASLAPLFCLFDCLFSELDSSFQNMQRTADHCPYCEFTPK